MNPASLEPIIRELIASKREGDYWDFKVKPHDNKADLLHDVLCLANSLHQGDRFLIFGVEDHANGATTVGLDPTKSRKTQADYLDFLAGQQFAGGNRPALKLVPLVLYGLEVEVLIIADRPVKPYWLTEDYVEGKRRVRQHIYTRDGDRNTAMDKSADLVLVEKMWQQRFGMDVLPMERMRQLLHEPAGWEVDFDSKSDAYHRSFPAYQVKLSATELFWEAYNYSFPNRNAFLGTAEFFYNATKLFELEYVKLDEMRLLLPSPAIKQVLLLGREMWYHYYNRSTPAGDFLAFLTAKRPGMESRGSKAPFLVFRDQDEQQAFHNYLDAHQEQLADALPGLSAQLAAQEIARDGYSPVIDLLEIDQIGQLYSAWRSSTDYFKPAIRLEKFD
ncbi:RNA-binding domain-containing protein [Hymenobacter monticola]|uniref:Schlafen AlbA-2 domain-containing protein n=1 Tax=Hymenobacter monticola TaxID=1705399 RepID=A0ABY4BIN8_9BACT|nr:RNA-binding domain-containing protein [Hymenobacter monticola]UOE36475.1 hypothetical protein MTP16_23595 [Hymenobacter monticola]